jgi:hypothetical protein
MWPSRLEPPTKDDQPVPDAACADSPPAEYLFAAPDLAADWQYALLGDSVPADI